MSTPPSRPRFTPANRPSKFGEISGILLRFAFIAAMLFGVYLLYTMNGATTPPQVPPQASIANGPRVQSQPERTPADSPPKETARRSRYAPAESEGEPQRIEDATVGSIQKQQLATGKFKQRQVIAAYDEVKRALDEWEKEEIAWQQVGPSLLKSDDGKRIAADETLSKKFRAILEEERTAPEQRSVAKSGASDLIAPVKEAENNPNDASLPSEDIVKSLQEIRSQAKKARDEFRKATEQAQAILAQAKAQPGPPGGKTLQEAIATLARQDADARMEFVAAKVKKAEDEGNKKVAEEKAKAALAAKERQAESIRAESEKMTRAAEAEAETRTQLAKMARLRQKVRSPEVRKYLGPFLASGFSQPKSAGGNSVIFDKSGDEGPMSLTRIRNVGGLDKGEKGIVVLNWIASSNYNDRTEKWNYGIFAHELSPDSMRFIKTAQDLLKELGDALVEEKMLAP